MGKRYPNSCESSEKLSIHNIVPVNTIQVLCASDWIVIQQRKNGSEEFYRSFRTYKNGFGDLEGDFFIGLEKLHMLTKQRTHELYIQLRDFAGNIRYAHYDNFQIVSQNEDYVLRSLGEYRGNATDAMRKDEGHSIFTHDSDNCQNCANERAGGWWYSSRCGYR